MSAPVVGIATQNGRLAVTFTRDGKLEGWAYFDELSYEARDTFLEALEIQKKDSRGKIDLGKIAQELRENDPFVRTRCRALARVAMAHRLGFEAECLPSDTDGSPHLVLKVPESVPQEKRIEDWLTVYFVGLEAEKQIYGSYTGDGNGEIGDLAGQFHLDKSHLLKPSNAATEQQRLGDLRGVEVSNLTQELRDLAIKLKDDRHAQEAALDQPYHLVFFRATDREGRTRFFDLMPQTDGVSIAETAVSAPKLGECVETAYGLPDRRGTHHVHRLYGKVRANTAREAIDNFAKLAGLRQVVEIAETQTQREAGPTWKLVFEKLGCPPTCTDSKPAARTKAREEDTKLAAQGRRILVVHHERVIAEVICKLLLHEGYGAQVVCSSSEAIAKALEWMPQLLIIDPVMPGVSGIVAAKEICGQTKCKVLLISASAKEPGFADILNNLRNNGCDCEAFPLPFEKEDLLEHVRERIGPPSSTVNGISLADSVHVDRKLETMDQKQRPKLAMTQHELTKDQKVENRRSMTTEQLAEKVIQDIQQMSPEEKAEVRKHLDQAFKPQNPEEKEEDRNNLLHGKQFEGGTSTDTRVLDSKACPNCQRKVISLITDNATGKRYCYHCIPNPESCPGAVYVSRKMDELNSVGKLETYPLEQRMKDMNDPP